MKKHHHVTIGGTFDHFHRGHQAMLTKTFEIGDKVWLGITTPRYLSTIDTKSAKLADRIQPLAIRQQVLTDYLQSQGWKERVVVIPIDDKYGTTLTDEKLEAIVVSPETELVATEINLLRAQKNWPALDVVVVPWVLADDSQPINSVRIRKGDIDREGRLYRLPDDWGVRRLPDELRPQLRRPFGKLLSKTYVNTSEYTSFWQTEGASRIRNKITDSGQARVTGFVTGSSTHNLQLLISVGDAVTKNLLENDLTPDISIVDFKIRRKVVHKNIAEFGFRDIKVFESARNKPGTLSYGAYTKLLGLIKEEARPAVLRINGEEDLMTLLAIFLAPLNSLIVYGQPDEGIVVVEVTEEKKEKARQFLSKFR